MSQHKLCSNLVDECKESYDYVLFKAGEFLSVSEYKNVVRWTEEINKRPAVQGHNIALGNELLLQWISDKDTERRSWERLNIDYVVLLNTPSHAYLIFQWSGDCTPKVPECTMQCCGWTKKYFCDILDSL